MVREMVDGWTRAPIALGAALLRLAPHEGAAALAQMKQLERLVISGNNAGPEGAAALAMALCAPSMKNLLYLDISRNKEGAEAPDALAPALALMTSLEVMRIGPLGEVMETPSMKKALTRRDRMNCLVSMQ